MYAIIETGGKQIKVEDNSVIWVEKLDAQEGKLLNSIKCFTLMEKSEPHLLKVPKLLEL